MELQQIQQTQLNQHQLQGLALLQMSAPELDAYLQELSMENPLVELTEANTFEPSVSDNLLHKLQWLLESDWQNSYYHQPKDEDELDPLMMVGTDGGFEDTLFSHLMRQLAQKRLNPRRAQAVMYLILSLDSDGYLRTTLDELADNSDFSVEQLYTAKEILCSFEPAGVGAADLSECLMLQLDRIGGSEAAVQIVREHLELLARGNLHAIAKKLGITDCEVADAVKTIRELDPRPGAGFKDMQQTQFIQPDLYVTEESGHLEIHPAREKDRPFVINQQYLRLLKSTTDVETKSYLMEKLSQAESVLRSIDQRKTTVLRCAEKILEHQAAFFRQGAEALYPLRVEDIAEELGVHGSTVSRAIRGKHLQCAFGLFPLSYFFMQSAGKKNAVVGNTAARALLRRLIDQENKAAPLSDQKLCDLMQENGCEISRRTVAKYREEMNIPSAHRRKPLSR